MQSLAISIFSVFKYDICGIPYKVKKYFFLVFERKFKFLFLVKNILSVGDSLDRNKVKRQKFLNAFPSIRKKDAREDKFIHTCTLISSKLLYGKVSRPLFFIIFIFSIE